MNRKVQMVKKITAYAVNLSCSQPAGVFLHKNKSMCLMTKCLDRKYVYTYCTESWDLVIELQSWNKKVFALCTWVSRSVCVNEFPDFHICTFLSSAPMLRTSKIISCTCEKDSQHSRVRVHYRPAISSIPNAHAQRRWESGLARKINVARLR